MTHNPRTRTRIEGYRLSVLASIDSFRDCYFDAKCDKLKAEIEAIPLVDEIENKPQIVERGLVSVPCFAMVRIDEYGPIGPCHVESDACGVLFNGLLLPGTLVDLVYEFYADALPAFERSLKEAEADRRAQERRGG